VPAYLRRLSQKTVVILPQRNGPLRVRGNLEICSGTGRTVKRTTGDVPLRALAQQAFL
jgi:hypothetical protein